MLLADASIDLRRDVAFRDTPLALSLHHHSPYGDPGRRNGSHLKQFRRYSSRRRASPLIRGVAAYPPDVLTGKARYAIMMPLNQILVEEAAIDG